MKRFQDAVRAGKCWALVVVLAHAAAALAADDAAKQKADAKADRLLKAASVDPADAHAGRAKVILGEWLTTLADWHATHDAELADLWSQWSKARAVVPKDEFPGEVVAARIDGVYDSVRPAYTAFIDKLSAELTPEQVDAVKEFWSRSPGNKRTYEAYLEIATDLTDAQKQVVRDRLLRAREDAMLTDSDKEIVNVYKRHKVKVEQYIGGLEWQKLHKAFAEKGRKPTTQKAD